MSIKKLIENGKDPDEIIQDATLSGGIGGKIDRMNVDDEEDVSERLKLRLKDLSDILPAIFDRPDKKKIEQDLLSVMNKFYKVHNLEVSIVEAKATAKRDVILTAGLVEYLDKRVDIKKHIAEYSKKLKISFTNREVGELINQYNKLKNK